MSVTFLVFSLLLSLALPWRSQVSPIGYQTATAGYCKQISTALRIYAAEHNGKFPDSHESKPSTANEVFRLLIREGVLDDERIFGAKLSPFVPDNNLGAEPDFLEAVKPGENHWAMTKGLNDESKALTPLVFENPASPTWPPKWNADAAGAAKSVRGRAWKGGKVIVGYCDSSVTPIQLEATKGSNLAPARDASGKDAFTSAAPTGSILDIEP